MNDTRLNDFITILKKKITKAGLNLELLEQNTLSDGVVNFSYDGMQIGRIYFGKRTSKIQVIFSDNVEWFNNKDFDFYVSKIDLWIEYLTDILNRLNTMEV